MLGGRDEVARRLCHRAGPSSSTGAGINILFPAYGMCSVHILFMEVMYLTMPMYLLQRPLTRSTAEQLRQGCGQIRAWAQLKGDKARLIYA